MTPNRTTDAASEQERDQPDVPEQQVRLCDAQLSASVEWRQVLRACQAAARTARQGFGPRTVARAAAVEVVTARAEVRILVAAVLAAHGAKQELEVDLAAYWRELEDADRLRAGATAVRPRPRSLRRDPLQDALPVERARALPITAVLERCGLRLRRCGRDFETTCPFCGQGSRSRNLRVYPRARYGAGRFYCFACQAAGDGIAFVMRLKGLDFAAAVREVAA